MTHAAGSQEPKPARPFTAEQQEKLKERDRLVVEANRLQTAGKLVEAIAAMERSVALHRDVIGRDDLAVLKPLSFIAELHESREDFAAARKIRQEVLDLASKRRDKEHWQVTDARLALADLDRLEKMPAADRKRLDGTRLLNLQMVRTYRQGKVREAVALAEQVLETRKELLGEKHPDYATSLNNLGELRRAQGDYPKAEPLFRQASEVWRQALGENHPHYVSGLHNLGTFYQTQGDYARAESFYRQAMERGRQVLGENDPLYAGTLNGLALVYQKQGMYAKAEPLYRQALEIRRQLGEKHPDYAITLNSLATLYHEQGNYAKAETLYRQALELRKQVLGEKHPDYANSLNNLAGLYLSKASYAEAEPLYRQALELRRQVLGEKHPDYAESLSALAGLYMAQGDYRKAEALYRQALEIRKQVLGEKHPDYAISLSNLAGVYESQGDYVRAELLCRQALEIRRLALGDKNSHYATGLSNLVTFYKNRGDYARAEPLCRQVLELRKQLLGDRHPDYAITLNMLGDLYKLQGDYAKAGPLYRQALEIRKQALGEKHPDYAASLTNLAELYRIQREYTRAEPLYDQALEIYRQVLGNKHAHYANAMSNLAKLCLAQGNYARAETLFQQARDVYKQSVGEKHHHYIVSLNNLAAVYQAQGNYAKAEPLYRQMLDLAKQLLGEKHPEYANSLANLSRVYTAQEKYGQAEPLLRQAVALTRDHLDLVASAQSERQQLRMAESMRFQLDSYICLARIAGLNGSRAYEPVLSWKGGVTVRQQRLRLERRDPALAAELRSVSSRLAALAFATPEPQQREDYQQQILQLTERREQLEKDLAQKSAAAGQEQLLVRLSPEQLQHALPAGTVLVDFLEYENSAPDPKNKGQLITERRLVAFVVPAARRQSAEIVRVDLGPVPPLAEAIDKWRQTIGTRTRPLENDQDPAAVLRQRLWKPLEPYVKDAQTVLVSPDGVVARMPLAALPGSRPGSFLIEETALVVVPVPQLLPALLKTPASGSPKESLLLVGDVDYGAETAVADARSGTSREAAVPAGQGEKISWPRLPGSKTEVLAIRDTFRRYAPDAAVGLLQAGQASEAAVRQEAPKHRYLHVATHGFFADPRLRSALLPEEKTLLETGQFGQEGFIGFHPGLLSGLVLAGANRPVQAGHDDGILTALEVAELDLQNVELAVLSACETGLGATAGGEGVLGLQRAFQVAGARNVVTSLWKVDDDATAALMALFYHKLWQEKKPPLVALREAQLTLYHHPERIASLAKERGPDFDKLVQLPATPPKEAKPANKSPVKLWAAFVLSGAGK